jgi:Spy/CpxP family protein refolding chaperone
MSDGPPFTPWRCKSQSAPRLPVPGPRRIKMMATKRLVGLALVVGVGVFGAPLEAQRGPGGWVAGPGPHMGRSLEVALEHQAELGLTQDQIARLTEIHAALDRDVFP